MADEKQVETTTDVVEAESTEKVQGEEFDKARAMALIEKLRLEARDAAKLKKRLEEIDAAEAKRAEAELTEAQKAQKRVAELEAELNVTRREKAQQAAAKAVGLDLSLADRLHGETPEELAADAKALLDRLPKPAKPTPGINATNPANASNEDTFEQRHAKWKSDGQIVNPFTGGGVVWPPTEKPD